MRLLRILVPVILVALATITQPSVAASRGEFGGERFRAQAERQRPDGMQRPPHRDFRRAEQPPERDKRGEGRLTADERRELRRDIDRANREIYKGQQR